MTSDVCLVVITHIKLNATCFLFFASAEYKLFLKKPERTRMRTCDCAPQKDRQDKGTCAQRRNAALTQCSSTGPRINASTSGHRNSRCPSRFFTPKSTRRVQIWRAIGKGNVSYHLYRREENLPLKCLAGTHTPGEHEAGT